MKRSHVKMKRCISGNSKCLDLCSCRVYTLLVIHKSSHCHKILHQMLTGNNVHHCSIKSKTFSAKPFIDVKWTFGHTIICAINLIDLTYDFNRCFINKTK